MSWPPNPNKSAPTSPQHHSEPPLPQNALSALQQLLALHLKEKRSARRWGVFFKILTFVYLLLMILAFYGCSDSSIDSLAMNEPHVAVVELRGAIDDGGDTNARNINDSLTAAFENEHAKAVALLINSPGGSPVQSDEIYQHAKQLRAEFPDKKLYAIIADMGASGAYYVAASADEIWVNPSSLVGSIGVIMPSYNVEQLMGQLGVKDRTMTAGAHKDILSVSRELSADERAHIQQLLDETHQNFIEAVKAGRGDKLKNIEQNQLFSGLFWTGKRAVELGLADKTGGIDTLTKQLDLPVANYTYSDPMTKIFDRFGVQVGKGLGEGVKLSLLQNTEIQ